VQADEPSVGSNEQALRMNVTTGGEQASCSSQVGNLGEDHVRNRQGSRNGCSVNVEHLPVLCNVSGSDANLSHTHEFTNRNFDQYHGNVLGDLVLPKFSYCHKQNVVHFLAELDGYFDLKSVPESLKLPFAMKAVTDY
jgi:hypothetical protein